MFFSTFYRYQHTAREERLLFELRDPNPDIIDFGLSEYIQSPMDAIKDTMENNVHHTTSRIKDSVAHLFDSDDEDEPLFY